MNTFVIVGTKFETFAIHDAVISVDKFEALLSDRDFRTLRNSFFELGQGLSASRVERIVEMAERIGIHHQLLFDRITMCGLREVHKHSAANSVISIPVQVSANAFESFVYIDESGELLNDHITGQHLPGMVFTEAVRQLCLGVTETHFTKEAQKGSFLLTALNVRFLSLAFPLAIKAVYRILSQTHPTADSTDFAIDVTFTQRDKVVATGNATFELRNRRVVSRHEHLLARSALAAGQHIRLDSDHSFPSKPTSRAAVSMEA